MNEEIDRLLRVLASRGLISFADNAFVRGEMSEAEWLDIPLEIGGDEK